MRSYFVKLNDGLFMPILGLGTSAPSKVGLMVLAMEVQQPWVLINTSQCVNLGNSYGTHCLHL